MNSLIERYINNLTKEKLNSFAISNNINLTTKELDFTFSFIKSNWRFILSNHGYFNIEKYKEYYTKESFIKIKELINTYRNKYSKYL